MEQLSMQKKAVGINPQSQIHYIDHLAVICILMDIPLIFLEENDFILGQQYYPGLNAHLHDFRDFNPEFLIKNYDVLFLSDLWDRDVFHKKYRQLEQKYHKILRHVHCPHGFSDKGFYLQKCAREDILLAYGQNMLDMFTHHDVFNQLHEYVIVGNYRYTYFQQNRPFYDTLMRNEILSQFARQQPVIMYAPTWLDLEESTTFFDAYSPLLDALPAHYNMIVKLHPRLELDDAGRYYHIVGKYEHKPNILFLKDFPLVFPLLAHSDIYIGDMSSVGYDFLPFDKPMFFLNKQHRDAATDRGLFLFRCGIEIDPADYASLYNIIEANIAQDKERFSTIRSDVYQYTFGPQKPFEQIKSEIIQCIEKPASFLSI